MKNAYILVGLCVILLAIGGYLYFSKSKDIISVSEQSSIVLYKEYGFITWREKNQELDNRVVENETVIPNNSYIRTVEGRGYILLPDNSSIALDTNTEILISYEPQKVSIIQSLGATYHRVEALVAGKTYEVETPNTLASVRGTKLLVKYDDKLKKSQVDVTEHKVFVTASASGTAPVLLEEGNSATVGLSEKSSASTTTGALVIDVRKTEAVKVRDAWLTENKMIDDVIKERTDKKETVRVIIQKLRDVKSEEDALQKKDTDAPGVEKDIRVKETNRIKRVEEAVKRTEEVIMKDDSSIREKSETTEAVKEESRPEPVETKTETTQPIVKSEPVLSPTGTTGTVKVITKINEEVFFDKFNTLFVNNFYLDEGDALCQLRATPAERVRVVVSYANESGYPFTSTSLLSFAQALEVYCVNKDVSVKAKLQARFDAEFPFNE